MAMLLLLMAALPVAGAKYIPSASSCADSWQWSDGCSNDECAMPSNTSRGYCDCMLPTSTGFSGRRRDGTNVGARFCYNGEHMAALRLQGRKHK
jgi:hypothetical protein